MEDGITQRIRAVQKDTTWKKCNQVVNKPLWKKILWPACHRPACRHGMNRPACQSTEEIPCGQRASGRKRLFVASVPPASVLPIQDNVERNLVASKPPASVPTSRRDCVWPTCQQQKDPVWPACHQPILCGQRVNGGKDFVVNVPPTSPIQYLALSTQATVFGAPVSDHRPGCFSISCS